MGISPMITRLMEEITRRYEQQDSDIALEEIRRTGEDAIQSLLAIQEAIDTRITPRLVRANETLDKLHDINPNSEPIAKARDEVALATEELEELEWAYAQKQDIEDLNQNSTFLEERTEAMYRELYNTPTVTW